MSSIDSVYQIDFSDAFGGKRVSGSKRRVCWRFGFTNQEALGKGLVGTDCRGQEHEVTFVWSFTSGKRVVAVDGQQIHTSTGKRSEPKFEFSWQTDGHVFQITAYGIPGCLNKRPGFNPFTLYMNGLSFFDMPRIFELGKQPTVDMQLPTAERNAKRAMAREESWHAPPEQYTLQYDVNRSASAPEISTYTQPVRRSTPVPVPASRAPPLARAESNPLDLISTPPMNDQFASPVPSMHQSSPTLVMDEFTPVDPSKQAPSFQAISNQILGAYQPMPPTPVPMLSQGASDPTQLQLAGPSAPTAGSPSPTAVVGSPPTAGAPRLTMNSPLSVMDNEGVEVDEIDRALKNLVNFDDISQDAPEQLKLTMMKQEEKVKQKKNQGQPLPPREPAWHLGHQPSLTDIQAHSTKTEPTKEVMRTHAFDPTAHHAGMMVAYGAPQASPPPTGYSQYSQGRQAFAAY